MPIRTLIAAAGATLLVVAACGPNTTPVSQAPAAPPGPTSAPAAAAQPAQGTPPTAVARPTQPTSTATDPQPTTAVQSSTGANDVVKLVLDPASSQAKYHAHEQLV